MSRGSRIDLALSVTLERAEDLDLLTWLDALPVARQAVRDLVTTRARARRRRRQGEPADEGGRRAPGHALGPSPALSPSGTPGPSLEAGPRDGDRASPSDAEVRLDRLLQSFRR